MRPLSRTLVAKILSQFSAFLLILVALGLFVKIFQFNVIKLSILHFIMFSISCLVKNFSIFHKPDKYTTPCSTNLFTVSIFIPRSCTHLGFILVYSVRHWSMPTFHHTVIHFSQQFLSNNEFLSQKLGSLDLSNNKLVYSLTTVS